MMIDIVSAVSSSVPLRTLYDDNIVKLLIFHLIPLTVGLIAGRFIFKTRDIKKFTLKEYFLVIFNCSVLIPIIFNTPLIYTSSSVSLNPDIILGILYYFFLFIILTLFGIFISSLWVLEGKLILPKHTYIFNEKPSRSAYKSNLTPLGLLLLTIVLVFLLNSVPYNNSEFIVGPDTYYHAAVSQQILEKRVIDNPFFYEAYNPYPPLSYYLTTILSLFFGLPIDRIWMLIPVLMSPIFLLLSFTSISKIFNSTKVASVSVIFIAVWYHVLFAGGTPRSIAWIFFAMFLLEFYRYICTSTKKSKYVLILLILVSLLTHFEIILMELIVLIAYYSFSFINRYMPKNMLKCNLNACEKIMCDGYSDKIFSVCCNENLMRLNLFLISIIFISFYQKLVTHYTDPSQWTFIHTYSEIPLSVFGASGAISILMFIFFPFAILLFLINGKICNIKIFILAILFLFSNSVFYYLPSSSALYSLHHRYFSEASYIFGVIPLSVLFLLEIKQMFEKNSKIFIIGFTIILLSFSVYPQLIYTTEYSQNTNRFVGNYMGIINYVHDNTEENSVILCYPSDFINRFLPYYGERYIFSGNYRPNDRSTVNVISVGGATKVRLFNFNLDDRNELAFMFYDNITISNLKNITDHYKVDYFLLTTNQYNESSLNALMNDGFVKKIGRHDGYELYKVNNNYTN